MVEHIIRAARTDDIEDLKTLCLEHALFERSALSCPPDAGQLAKAIFGRPSRLYALVVDVGEPTLAGYATYTFDFSTWHASRYLHLDCLYLRPSLRGLGIGTRVMARLREEALQNGCGWIEWQTPNWNESAKRFYSRLGACGKDKCRFSWQVSSHHLPPTSV